MASPDIRISGVVAESAVDGPGLRYCIFSQGCPHHCEGCHNPQTHDPLGGRVVSSDELTAELAADPLLSGVTFSGGEPFLQGEAFSYIANRAHSMGLNVMVYSGWTFEELNDMAKTDRRVGSLLDSADILVDGRFVLEERDLTLLFRGSRNQRLIDMNKTRKTGTVVLLSET